MKYFSRDVRSAQLEFKNKLNSIPKKNKQKFFVDLLKLIEYAQKDGYENFDFK